MMYEHVKESTDDICLEFGWKEGRYERGAILLLAAGQENFRETRGEVPETGTRVLHGEEYHEGHVRGGEKLCLAGTPGAEKRRDGTVKGIAKVL